MSLTRRQIIAGLAGWGACGLASPTWARTDLTIGDRSITSISDGNLVLPASMFFDGLPQEELSTVLAAHGIDQDQLTPPCNLTLLRGEGQTVLFDAGSGPAFMPSAGKLMDSLDALGVAPDEITHVVFTHAHPDHLWGVLDDFDDPVFPEAVHMIGEAEWAYWTDPNTVDTIGEARASFAVGAARRLEAVAEQMTFFKPDQEILPGVMAHASFGHTPGHMSFEIRSGGIGLLVGGDAIGNAHVAFAKPEWHSGSDQDPEQGAATRQRLLDQLAQDDIALLGFHLPNGGLGRVERRGDAYHFVAEDT